MLHAWLGFLLLLAFYVLSFGVPGSDNRLPEKERLQREGKAPPEKGLVLSGVDPVQ